MKTWREYEEAVEHYLGPLDELDLDKATWLPSPGDGWQMARRFDFVPAPFEQTWRISGRFRLRKYAWCAPELLSMMCILHSSGRTRDVPFWRVRLFGFNIERFGRGYPLVFGGRNES